MKNQNEQKVVLYGTNLFKSAMAIGAGIVVGKYLGKIINGALDGFTTGALKVMAKCGNSFAVKFCDDHNIEYGDSEDETKYGHSSAVKYCNDHSADEYGDVEDKNSESNS